MEFLGHKITPDGIQPLSYKLEAIQKVPVPEDITELRSFMGMAQQVARFSPELSKVADPLRDLLSVKSQWVWTPVHDLAFNAVKNVLTAPPILAHYDISKPTKIRMDDSLLNGISVIVYQKHEYGWRPVDCASRFLTPTEKNDYPIEIEMLAVTWGCNRMNKYLQGLPTFLIETDHKPLVPILNYKSLMDMSPRIQQLRMKLLQYQFVAEHVPGKELMDADAMSRAPVTQPTHNDELAEQEVILHTNTVMKNLPATEETLEQIRKHIKQDVELQELICTLKNGWPKVKSKCSTIIQPYWESRANITFIDGLLLNTDRIIIPQLLHQEMLQNIHQGHLGMVKCKRRARQSIFWPGMNKQIEKLIQRCHTCLKYMASKPKDPLMTHEVPNRSWEKVGSDLFHYAGRDYLIIVDYYSLRPEVYLLQQARTEEVIEASKDVFSRHGIPQTFISDNGSQYKSYKYKKFSKEWQFVHKTSSPRYPRSNGLAEATVKSIKRLLKKCNDSNEDVKKGLLIM